MFNDNLSDCRHRGIYIKMTDKRNVHAHVNTRLSGALPWQNCDQSPLFMFQIPRIGSYCRTVLGVYRGGKMRYSKTALEKKSTTAECKKELGQKKVAKR